MTSHETDSEHTRDDPEVPGLAGERTDMAWNRSALAVAVAAAALLRRVWENVDTDNGRVVVFTLLGIGALGWVAALGWARGAARTTLEGRQVANPIVLRRVAAGTLMFCVAALILAFIPTEG